MMMPRPLQIGITIGLHAPDESLWVNGIKQNALFLAKALRNSRYGHKVRLLNTTDVVISDQLPWSLAEYPTMAFDAGCDGLDVVIELGGQISAARTSRIKAQGTRLVSYCCGAEYVLTIEAIIFRRPLWDSIFINDAYDSLWVIPQIYETSAPYLQTFRRCPVVKVPFVWDPFVLKAAIDMHGLPGRGEYFPNKNPKRLSIIEQNVDVLKFCLYPILIAERSFRVNSEYISFLHVANSDGFVRDDREFSKLMHHLDIVKAHKASFIGRVTTPLFLQQYTDVVLSHQWGLPLNYMYLEVCWQGYPLVHNAELVSDLGYYYKGNDIEQGSNLLNEIITRHDIDWQEYRDQQRRLIQRFLASNPDVSDSYDALLFDLIGNKAG